MNPNIRGMAHFLPSMSYQLSKARPPGNRSSRTLIHQLDDDSLLIIFSFCRLLILEESAADYNQLLDGGEWNHEWWWHRLIQVCRRWRYLVLEAAFHLQVSLVCATGTPVAEMLAHSPPVPLIVDHIDNGYGDLTPEDEEGIMLALQHHDRVRRIRIRKSVTILDKLIVALESKFPILEFLSIDHHQSYRPSIPYITNLTFPETFRAPHLCQLVLENFATSIESPSLTTMANLVTLWLTSIPSSGYFPPNVLLQRLSLMPRLETLGISFNFYDPRRDVKRQLLHKQIMTPVTLSNLHWLYYGGPSAYSEALLPWVTTPLLERFQTHFYNQMIYSIPCLRQFMSTTRNVVLKIATVTFYENCLMLMAYPHEEARPYTWSFEFGGKHLDWQVVSAAQIFHQLKTVFSAVEHLSLRYGRHNISSEWNRRADRTYWRKLLGSFGTAKTVRVEYGLVEHISLALEPEEGESSTELLPELQKLSYSVRGASRAFALFIDARKKAGRPLTVDYIF